MLAIYVRDLGPEVGRWDELVNRRVDEHAGGVDSRFVAEDVEPDPGLGWLHGNPADALEVAGQHPELLVLEAGDLDAEEVPQLHHHLVHGRVSGSLADAVDARGEHLRA